MVFDDGSEHFFKVLVSFGELSNTVLHVIHFAEEDTGLRLDLLYGGLNLGGGQNHMGIIYATVNARDI